jgi:hypothetical protein
MRLMLGDTRPFRLRQKQKVPISQAKVPTRSDLNAAALERDYIGTSSISQDNGCRNGISRTMWVLSAIADFANWPMIGV